MAGMDLIYRYHPCSAGEAISSSGEAYGPTFALSTTTTGEKIGNSAGNAIWSDVNLTTPFQLHQVYPSSLQEGAP